MPADQRPRQRGDAEPAAVFSGAARRDSRGSRPRAGCSAGSAVVVLVPIASPAASTANGDSAAPPRANGAGHQRARRPRARRAPAMSVLRPRTCSTATGTRQTRGDREPGHGPADVEPAQRDPAGERRQQRQHQRRGQVEHAERARDPGDPGQQDLVGDRIVADREHAVDRLDAPGVPAVDPGDDVGRVVGDRVDVGGGLGDLVRGPREPAARDRARAPPRARAPSPAEPRAQLGGRRHRRWRQQPAGPAARSPPRRRPAPRRSPPRPTRPSAERLGDASAGGDRDRRQGALGPVGSGRATRSGSRRRAGRRPRRRAAPGGSRPQGGRVRAAAGRLAAGARGLTAVIIAGTSAHGVAEPQRAAFRPLARGFFRPRTGVGFWNGSRDRAR